MTKHLWIFLVIVFYFNVKAQQWNWADSSGKWGNQHEPFIKSNSQDELFSVLNNGPGYGTYSGEITVSKRAPDGEILWSKILGGTTSQSNFARDLVIDDESNIYILGFYSGQVIFANDTFIASNGWRKFLCSYDRHGNERWIKNLNSNVSVTRNLLINRNNQDLLLIESNSNTIDIKAVDFSGTQLWQKTFTSPLEITNGTVRTTGEILLCGFFSGSSFQIDNISYNTDSGFYDGNAVIRLHSSGAVDTVEILPGVFQSEIHMDQFNNLYISGRFNNKMKVRQYLYTVNNYGPSNVENFFLVKISDHSDTCLWGRKIEHDYYDPQLFVNDDGTFYYAATLVQPAITFDSITLTKSVSREAVFVYKFNEHGQALWGTINGGGENANSWVSKIASVPGSGEIYLAGSYRHYYNSYIQYSDQSWFGGDTLQSTIETPQYFLAKLKDVSLNAAVTNFDFSQDCRIFPNPTSDLLNIIFENKISGRVSVIDKSGRRINEALISDTYSVIIDVSGISKGIYVLRVDDNQGGGVTKKFIVN